MADETLITKIHDLSDLELAALICLVTEEHCIIDTAPELLDDLVQELELVCEQYSDVSLMLTTVDCVQNVRSVPRGCRL